MPNDRNNWIREVDGREDVRPDARMQFHFFEFSLGELARLVENVFRDRQLSHVVEQCCCFDGFQKSFVSNPNFLCEASGVGLDSANVAMRDLVLGIDGHRQRFDC